MIIINLNKKKMGFSLIELIVAIGIIGTLTRFAVSSYLNYTIKAKIAQGLVVAEQVKKMFVDYYSATGKQDPSISDLGIEGTTFANANISSVAIENINSIIRITVNFNNRVITVNNTPNLYLESNSISSDGTTLFTRWSCNSTTIKKIYLPASCEYITFIIPPTLIP